MMISVEDALHEEGKLVQKIWKKPTMCTIPVGMKMSRYFPAQPPPKK